MIYRTICILLILAASACTKNGSETEPAAASVSFTLNGHFHQWVERFDHGENFMSLEFYAASDNSEYIFSGSNYIGNAYLVPVKTIFMSIPTAELKTNTTYTIDAGPGVPQFTIMVVVSSFIGFDPAAMYQANQPGEGGTITFTRLENRRADGYFTARISRASDGVQYTIPDGKFTNVRMN